MVIRRIAWINGLSDQKVRHDKDPYKLLIAGMLVL